MFDVTLIQPRRFGDERGWFCETWSERGFARLGLDSPIRQDNHAFSGPPFVLRGLHFQAPPHGQAKLVRCIAGRILDVAVDLRRGSPTFGRWVAAELDAESGRQLFVPVGFAHGYLTLEPDTQVEYKVSEFYAPQADGGVIWNDPDIGVDWPLHGATPVLSPKDERLPRLSELDSPFVYEGSPLREGPLEAVSL